MASRCRTRGHIERSKIIGIFLAVLELLRHYGFRAEQPLEFADIIVLPALNAAATISAVA